MGDLTGDLVAHPLRWDGGNFVTNTLVILEIEAELAIETLDDKLGGSLSSLGTDTSHVSKGRVGPVPVNYSIGMFGPTFQL